ncbi:MAG TPA: hypothetical protein VGH87_27600 [Polyangiaceae bacterium]
MMIRVAAYRHYLGEWNAKERVLVGDRAADDAELVALGAGDVIGDAAALATNGDAVLAAFTATKRVRKRLWDLDWDDEGASPRDPAAFQAYGRSLAAFLRAAGMPTGETPEMRLVAGGPGANAVDDLARHANVVVALVNVGESDVLVTTNAEGRAISLRVPPDEGCLVSPKARPYVLTVPASAEFGLLLEIA